VTIALQTEDLEKDSITEEKMRMRFM